MLIPTPDADPVMADLFRAVCQWQEKHGLTSETEAYYLSCLLAGRLDVGRAMVAVKNLPDLYPETGE